MTVEEQVISKRMEFTRGVILTLVRARQLNSDWPTQYREVKKLIRQQFGEKPAIQLRACRWSVPIRRELNVSLQPSSLSEGWLRSAEDYYEYEEKTLGGE